MAASEGIDQASLIKCLLAYMSEVAGIPDLELEQTIDGQTFIQLLFRIDEDYFKQSAINISQDPIRQHGWVLNAARLKRIYLRLMGHFSFALQLDPSRLLVPDCNVIAKKGTGWEAHWLRLGALVFFALYKSDPVVKSRFGSIPVISAWIKQIEGKLERGSGSSIEFESSPASLYSLEIPDFISTRQPSSVKSKSVPMGTITPPPTWPLNPPNCRPQTAIEVPSIYPSLENPRVSASNRSTSSQKEMNSTRTTWNGKSQGTEVSEKDVYEAKIQGLQAELAKCKKSEPSEDLSHIEEIAVLEIELDGTKAKLRKEADRAQRLQVLINEQNERIEALGYANEELKADMEDKDTALARLEEELETTSAKATQTAMETIKELHEQTALQVPKELLEEEQERSRVYADNIVVLEKMVEGMDSELSEAQLMLASSAVRIRELEAQPSTDQGSLVRMLEDELVRKNEQLEATRLENETTKVQLGEALGSLADLQTRNLSAPASVSADATLQEELAAKSQLIADLEEALAYEKRNAAELKKQTEGIDADQERALLLQQELRAIEQDYNRQKGLLAELDLGLKAERENSALLREALDLKEAQLVSAGEAQNNDSALKEAEWALTKQTEDLRSKLQYAQKENDENRKRISELEETLSQREEDLKTMASASESNASLSNSLAEKEDQIYKLESELALLSHSKARLEKLEKTLSAKDRKISELEGMLVELEEELAELGIQLTAVKSEQQHANIQNENLEIEKNKITASIEDLQLQISQHNSHLLRLSDIQSKIDSTLQAVELDRITPIERFIGSKQCDFNRISSSVTNLKDITTFAGEKVQNLATIQEKIEQMQDSLERDRIEPLEIHTSHLERLLQDVEIKVSELKEQKETAKTKDKMNSDEQQMILAAWHDLGLKIMKMKVTEK